MLDKEHDPVLEAFGLAAGPSTVLASIEAKNSLKLGAYVRP
jgi:hypothetical protein